MDTKELVERCKRGEKQAMDLLYTECVRKMERVSRKYVKNEADVQDIVHDSFVIIFTSIDRLKDAEKLESWMLTIVRNLSLKHQQRPSAVSMEGIETEPCEAEENEPDYGKLMAIVEQLPQGYKNVLKLSILEGLSHKEIGEMLGIAQHSSSSQLARAKVMVMRRVKRYGVLLLALIAAVIPFLLPEEEQEKKPEMAKKTPKKDVEETMPDSTKTDSPTEQILVPVRSRHLVAKQVEEQTAQDTLQTLIAEAIGRDTTTTQPIDVTRHEPLLDTVRQEPRIVPDARPNDRLIAEEYPAIKKHVDEAWALAVSFTGGSDNTLLASANVPGTSIGSGVDDPIFEFPDGPNGTDFETPDTIVNTRTRHYMPLTFGFSLSKPLSKHWSLETGLRYTLLRSDITTTTSVSDGSMPPTTETITRKLHYIGIPLRLTYNLWNTRQFSLYTSGGVAADIPVGSTNPVFWSVNLGAGFQYKITSSINLYVEPSMNYYLNSSSGTTTIYTDRPFEFTIPVGLRLSW